MPTTKKTTAKDTKIGKNGCVEVYKDSKDKFHARFRDRNGNILFKTSGAHEKKVAAINAIKAMAKYFGGEFSVSKCDSTEYVDLTK